MNEDCKGTLTTAQSLSDISNFCQNWRHKPAKIVQVALDGKRVAQGNVTDLDPTKPFKACFALVSHYVSSYKYLSSYLPTA